MTRLFGYVCLAGMLLLGAFDFLLLRSVRELRSENLTLRGKVEPTLGEQYELFEYRQQGVDVSNLVAELSARDRRLGDLLQAGVQTLLFYFPGEDCRRSLNYEMRLLEEHRAMLLDSDVSWALVFSRFGNQDFTSLTQQFGITDRAFLDPEDLFREAFGVRGDPVILLLDERYRVRLARVSRTRDEAGSRRMYERIAWLTSSVVIAAEQP